MKNAGKDKENLSNQAEIDKNLKLLLKSSYLIFIGLIFSKIFTYLYRIILARNFGPEVYGLFSLAIMVSGWFIVFASIGLPEGLLRFIPWYRGRKQDKEIQYIFSLSTRISLSTGLIAGILLFLFSGIISINIFNNPNLIIFLKIFAFLIPLSILANIFIVVLQSFEEIKWYSFILNILQNGVKVLALFVLIFLGFQSNAVIFSYFIGALITFVVSYLVCKCKFPQLFKKSFLTRSKKGEMSSGFFSYSWPLLFSGVINLLFFWVDSFSIGFFRNVTEVGLYNAAVPIVLLLGFAPEIFIKIFSPLIAREFSKGKFKVVKELSQQIGKWIFILNFPFFILMFLFPGVIINILFGPTYLPATNSLRILLVGGFIGSLAWIPNSLLAIKGKSKLILITLAGVSIMNLFLNIILVPKYGLEGAAYATTFSKIVLSVILIVEAKHHLSIIPFRRKIFRIILLTFIPLFLVLFLKTVIEINLISLILLGAFFSLGYVLLLLLTHCLDKNDLMILGAIKKKII